MTEDLTHALQQLSTETQAAIAAANDLAALDAVRVGVLGKKGRLTALLKGLGGMEPEARKAAGAQINVVKDEIQTALDARKTALETAALASK